MLTQTIERPGPVSAPLDTRVPPYVRIVNGSLDEDPTSPGKIILMGRIDPTTFRFLRVDPSYQRKLTEREDIFSALKEGAVPPPIDIGVRGQDFICDGNDYLIRSPAYIIDGQQRWGNASRLFELVPQLGIRLFAMAHFDSTAAWEKSRFDAVNKNIVKVSPDLHLQNLRDSNPAVLTLYGLTHNAREFPLYKRVSWSQNMERSDLLKATMLAKTARHLHGHKTTMWRMSIDEIAASLNRAADNVTLPIFRANVIALFKIINECWPFANIEYRRAAPQLKSSFLAEVARMFSQHRNFWDAADRELLVLADDRRKLAAFPINDPTVLNLAGSGGAAKTMLYRLLVDHMNSGRRTHRLVERSK